MRVLPNLTIEDGNFTRASTATYVNVAGLVASAAVNVIRANFHPITHAAEGVLLESAATNLFSRSEEHDNAAWTAALANFGAAVVAPDGATTAEKFQETATSGVHSLTRAAAVTIVANTLYTWSVWVKVGDRTKVQLKFGNVGFTNSVSYDFDASAGTASAATVTGTTTQNTIRITPYGSGWYRVGVTAIIDAVSTTCNVLYSLMNAAATNYAGTAGLGLYLWGSQLEAGSIATSYIPTVATSLTRAPDVTTGATLISSSVPEPDTGEVLWVAATPYVIGDIRYWTDHRKYKCLINVTSSTPPSEDSTNWEDIGATNKYATFDLNSNQQTVTASPYVIVVSPNRRIDGIALVGLEAAQVNIRMTVGSTVYYDETTSTQVRNTISWLTYLTGSFRNVPTLVEFALPAISGATITITLIGSTIKCAGLIMGTSVYLGKAQYDAEAGWLNFSRIERDDFGTLSTLVPRKSVPKIDIKTELPKANVNTVREARKQLNAVVALYSGLDDLVDEDYFESLLLVGIYREFSINLTYPDCAIVSLQLEEI